MKATAVAHPNLALVKYWGKRDEALILPQQSSLSLTIAPLEVRTTVELGGRGEDVILNGKDATEKERDRVVQLVSALAREAGVEPRGLRMISRGNFPAAAGLASSAAAFAALAVATRAALGLPRDVRAESIAARRGSGSASRSIEGGFCVWHRGSAADGSDSYAEAIFDEAHWPEVRMVVAVVDQGEKKVKSRDGMRLTQETSPYYPAWVASTEREIAPATELIRRRDLAGLGALAERNAWRMHASAMAAEPPVCYLKPRTLEMIQRIEGARDDGLRAWFTLDAGPNPVILTERSQLEEVEQLLRACGAIEVTRCEPGRGARVVEEHLF